MAPPTVPGGSAPPQNPVVDGVRVDVDPFTNPGSQHRTEVEPSAYASGGTIVAAFQTGRFFDAGASDIDFATSRDGGASWVSGPLPGTTDIVTPGSAVSAVSDAAVAFDARHGVWLVTSLPVVAGLRPAGSSALLINRSTDGISWAGAVGIIPSPDPVDKNWVVCDTHPASPFYGSCYIEYDDGFGDGVVHMSVSRDGGVTWSAPGETPDLATGIGGQPLVRADGTVVVPYDDDNEAFVNVFLSHDGGASWTGSRPIAPIAAQVEGGDLRSSPLPGAAMDASGTAYVTWQDCRYRAHCAFNDIVFSRSGDGIAWSQPQPLPNPNGEDRFIVGLGADPVRPGHLGLTYYAYDDPACASGSCKLRAWFTASPDGGSTWSAPLALAGPIALASLPQTAFGRMFGDYVATVYANDSACSIFVSANAASGTTFDESTYARCMTVAGSLSRAQLRSIPAVPLSINGARWRRRVLPPD